MGTHLCCKRYLSRPHLFGQNDTITSAGMFRTRSRALVALLVTAAALLAPCCAQQDGKFVWESLDASTLLAQDYKESAVSLEFVVSGSETDKNWHDVACGGLHTCAIKKDTKFSLDQQFDQVVFCWGRDEEGQATVPDALATVKAKAVYAGWSSSCMVAIETPNVLNCWGTTPAGTSAVASQSAGKEWIRVSLGHKHACGIVANAGELQGDLVCWGDDTDEKVSGKGTGQFKDVCVGISHSCSIRADGRATCWGFNGLGRSPIPRALRSLQFSSLTCGVSHTCLMDDKGFGGCWGHGAHQQLQMHDQSIKDAQEISREAFRKWKVLTAGLHHTCGVKMQKENEVVCDDITNQVPSTNGACWGDKSFGQTLPDNRPPSFQDRPSESCNFMQWRTMSSGGYHTCGITVDDSSGENLMVCWGLADNNQTVPLFPASGAHLLPSLLLILLSMLVAVAVGFAQ